jgi:hypothetical protein
MAVSVSIEIKIPELLISSDVVRLKIENALVRKTGPELMRQFKKTVVGWDTQINFYQRKANRQDYVSVTVFTRFKQYAIVNAGSPPHTITSRRGGMLRFQTGYRAATSPRVISSRAKQRSGSFVAARSVQHPGFEARDFDVTIAEEIAPQFIDDVQEAIRIGSSVF